MLGLKRNIAIGCDHAGYKLKEYLKKELANKGYIIYDFGSFNEESVDYPDIAHPLAEAIEKKTFDYGILLCGSGNGVNITANKHKKIRAALCWTIEIARLARLHNDANILSLPARFIDEKVASSIVETFLTTDFEGGRHQVRVEKISAL
jgi:ribose 5-phosphate isomerase B